MGAGRYYERVQRLVYTVTVDSQTNQSVASYVPDAILWAWVKETSATEQVFAGAKQHVVVAEIHVNQFPVLDMRDRLLDLRTNYVYTITGKVNDYDVYETVVSASRIPVLS